jgi:peptidoglycan/xylan/chitin deacetylase (PgdA/CDA1 family)
MPEKSVVITFDDGFRNVFTEALPILQKHGFTATVFLPTAFIGNPRRSFKDRECLTWDEVSNLQKCGIHFGSHTVNHPQLMELSWKDIEIEVRQSKAELEQHLGESINTFAHPYAFPQANRQYVQGVRKLLAESGYVCCATTAIGSMRPGDDPYCLKRLPVNSLDDLAFFRAKLEGEYDWLARPQVMIKRFKELVRASTKRNIAASATGNTAFN